MDEPVMDRQAMDEPLIRVEKLTKHFPVSRGLLFSREIGQVRAVDGISFSIKDGETLGLVGESGCGKTTTSKMMLRLETPTSGHIRLEGADIHALTPEELEHMHNTVQAVFQDPWSSLNPRMRVRDIIAEAMTARGGHSRQKVADRLNEVMAQVGLNPRMADRYPHEFSGGQRQRIAIAAALMPFPKLIVLDEPVSALDVSIRAQVMNLLKDLQEQSGVAYLMIAHNLATVRYMAHQTAVMYLGKFVEYGATEPIFRNPRHPYTKALFSASLAAHPDKIGEEIVLKGEVPSPLNPPPGCPFHPRCPLAMPRCTVDVPALKQIEPGVEVSCHLY